MNKVKDELDVTMSYAIPGDHVTEIERYNIKDKEIYHAQYHRLPIQDIPKVMIRYLAFEMVIKLDYFTVKGGLSPYYSPPKIVDQQLLDYNKHCTLIFRAFVQANNDKNPKKSNVSRTIDIIYLILLVKIQGGCEIFDLHSHRFIKILKMIETLILKAIIKHIE